LFSLEKGVAKVHMRLLYYYKKKNATAQSFLYTEKKITAPKSKIEKNEIWLLFW
jgi:hypothetical protein